MTIKDSLRWAIEQLAHSESPKIDAEILLSHILQKDRSYLYTWDDKRLDDMQQSQYRDLVSQRCSGKPVAHIIGHRDFWSLTLEVNDTTLIPRPDTELLVEQALVFIGDKVCRVLDLGTGTGAIALAIAKECPNAQVIGVDKIADAVDLANRNKARNQIGNCQFLQSDWFGSIETEKFDVIVSNPPYIDGKDPHLNQGDVRFEPKTALVADNFGLSDLELIVQNALVFLNPNGALMVEHGYDQLHQVAEMFNLCGYTNVTNYVDMGGNPRVTVGLCS